MNFILIVVLLNRLNELVGDNYNFVNNGFSKPKVLIGVIFDEAEKSSAAYSAFKLVTSDSSPSHQSTRARDATSTSPIDALDALYDFEFRTVFVDDVSDSFQMSGAICQLLVEGVVSILGPVMPRTMNTIRSFTNYHQLVYISRGGGGAHLYAGGGISSGSSPTNAYGVHDAGSMHAPNIIKMQPTSAEALADFIYEQKWSRLLFIYDSELALFRLRMLFELTNANNYELSTDARRLVTPANNPSYPSGSRNNKKKVDEADLIKYIDRQSRSHSKKQIVLDLSDATSRQQVFRQLKATLNNRADYHYILLNADYLELNHSYLVYGGINFTAFSLVNYESPQVIKFLRTKWLTNPLRASIKFTPTFRHSLSQESILQEDAALMIDAIEVVKRAVNAAGTPHEPTKTPQQDPNSAGGFNNYGDGASGDPSSPPCTPDTVPMWTARQLIPAIKKVSFNGLTGLVKFNESGFRLGYTLAIQEARMKQNLIKVGHWIQGKGIKRDEDFDHTIAKHHRKNKVRIVTSILVAPFLEVVRDANGKIILNKYQGFCVDLIDEVAREVNFTYIIKQVNDGSYGGLVNGSWNGMIGELMTHKADLAVAPLTITSSRERVVDFSTPFMEFGLSVMYLKLPQAEPELFAFMKPLSTDIWMCIAYAYLGVSVVLFMVSRLNPKEWNDDDYTSQKHNQSSIAGGGSFNSSSVNKAVAQDFSIFNSFWFSLSAFMQQGGDISPRSLSGRIVGGVWWFFTLIIVSSYTANLAAYLTVERMANPLKSYEDLSKQNRIKYGVVNSGSSKEFFSKSHIDVFRKMWQFMEANPDVFVNSIQQGYEKVLSSKGDYAFLLESTMNKYYNLQNQCKTTKIGQNLDSGKGYGIATPPGSDLRDDINLAVLKLKEKNIIPQMVQKWWDNRTTCSQPEESDETMISKNSVKLAQMKGLFLLLLGGLALGILLSLLELFYKCALESNRQNKPIKVILREMTGRPKFLNLKNCHSNSNHWINHTTMPPDETPISCQQNNTSRITYAI